MQVALLGGRLPLTRFATSEKNTTKKGSEMNLKRRIERMERDMKPAALRAVIQGLLGHSAPGTPFVPAALAADDPRLNHGVDETGEGTISPWWLVWFFEGTEEQQNARLKELRLDPQFQKPWSEGDIPVRFEGGAACEDAYRRIQEKRRNQKLTSA